MAAKTAKMLDDFDISGKTGRSVMSKLKDSGLEYVSSSGKVVAAKTQPGSLSIIRNNLCLKLLVMKRPLFFCI